MKVAKLSRRAAVASAMAGLASAALPARAQDFPNKPITIVVPFGPGTTNDVIARQLGQDMMGTPSQSVIIDNRAGATGNIAADLVAKSRPDGHTLFIPSMSQILNQVTGNATTDLTKDFTPVAFTGKGLYSMFVPNELAVKSVAELVELARQQPGKLNLAGYIGGVPQFVHACHVRPAGARRQAGPHDRGHRRHARRHAARRPDLQGSGYPDLTVKIVHFLMAAKGTPQPIVDRLYAAIDKALQKPKIKETLAAQGVEEKRGGPGDLSAYLAREIGRWGDIVKLSAPAAK